MQSPTPPSPSSPSSSSIPPSSTPPTSSSVSTSTQPPDGVKQLTREQLLARRVEELTRELAASKEREEQSQLYIQSMKEEEEKQEEEEEEEEDEKISHEAYDEYSQREIVRKSRESIHQLTSSSPTSLPFTTPIKPPVSARLATAARKRRESQGNPLYSPPPSLSTTMAETKGPSAAFIKAANMMSKNISHFYGDSTKDIKQDVRSFVKSVNVEFDTWMPNILEGRLQLVIRCTRDYALDWLCEKQRDLKELARLGVITNQDLLEWGPDIEEEFVKAFAGESTESQWKTKLTELRLGGKNGKDVAEFIAEFKKIASHLFPLTDYADTKGRSKLLAHLFADRVKWSNTAVWKQAYQGGATLNTLEEWEVALRRAWEVTLQVKQVENRQERLNLKERNERGRGTMQKASSSSTTPHSTAQSLLQMSSKEGQPGREEEENERGEGEGEMLQAAMTEKKEGKRSSRPFNKHIKPDQAMQLIKARKCLLCYREGHIASRCTQPANRAPTTEELKGRAGQQ